MKHKQKQKGFTLIELMIVVAIIGILAAIAIPSYQDYTARAQVSEAVSLAAGFKTGLAEYYQAEGTYPSTLNITAIGTTTSGKYVNTVTLNRVNTDSMTIISTMRADAAQGIRNLTLGIATTNGGQTWTCGTVSTTLLAKHRPAGCK